MVNVNLRKLFIFVLAAVLLVSAVSCSKPSDDGDGGFETIDYPEFDYMANDLTPYIKLGTYEGLDVKFVSSTVTEDELQSQINDLLKSYATKESVTDRVVAEGDEVLADYAGYLNGVAFSGGTATNQKIVAKGGSGYIEGFAEAFIGRTPGEEFSFNVTFPSNYGNSTLAGKEVTFVCKVHHINVFVLPELTDEFVKEKFNYNNVEEFMIIFREDVEEYAKMTAESDMFNELWPKIVANSEVISYPYGTVESVYQQQKVVYMKYAEQYKITYEQFLSMYLNKTDAELYAECQMYIKEDLIVNQLVKVLGIDLQGEEYDAMVERIAKSNGVSVETLKSRYKEESIRATANWLSVMDYVLAHANVITEQGK